MFICVYVKLSLYEIMSYTANFQLLLFNSACLASIVLIIII